MLLNRAWLLMPVVYKKAGALIGCRTVVGTLSCINEVVYAMPEGCARVMHEQSAVRCPCDTRQ